ncbi:galactose mutarotase [Actinomadura sp. NBRC 104412]|uniref:aldose 1-epimerase family protein n=1 Tax=Actinomadura sp. NBRC 104412 TaxID=3032203 RepID=UPI0024A327CA|nr:aldose 1-epimerase family protein [Actinomadura sp. NBRC 104412]GLZ03585.1 galactose mutarotase [Actinomadura sp. NBRC 104412]
MTESIDGEPISGVQHVIAAGPYRAVVTEAGAGLRELERDGLPLVLSFDADEPIQVSFGQLLIPWPNRIDRGRYAYDGRIHQLDLSEPKNECAIHGLVRSSPWTLVEREPHRVRLAHRLMGRAGYPFRLDLEADYALDAERGLTVRLSARNVGTRTAPYGHGAHPYLTVGEPIDDCAVTVTADRWLPVDERLIPSGPAVDVTGTPYDLRNGRRLGGQVIDNAFTGLRRDAAGRAWVRLTGGGRTTALWADAAHPWLEVVTADAAPGDRRRRGLGAEPMTCPPNAFATGIDVIHLRPGAHHTGSWGIMAE